MATSTGATSIAPYVQRARARTLPADAHGAYAYATTRREPADDDADEDTLAMLRVRTADGGALRTIADLRALWARHGDAS